ncbi:MAG: DEAD/DEAH box helicase [Azonexus sp.]|jgi:hypothetical protein|nr:DEAD/DEAH box helicase [Azonexus sp.]
MSITPVTLRPPELLLKAVSDGLRIGIQVLTVPGLMRPLAGQGAWWFAPRRMWVMQVTSHGEVCEAIQSAYLGQFVDLDGVESMVAAAMKAPEPDFFTALLDVQIFPLMQGQEQGDGAGPLNRGKFAVSALYDGLYLKAMRSLSGYFHKYASAWQVRAAPDAIMERLGHLAGIAPEFIFVHEQPVVLEELSSPVTNHLAISVPARTPERGLGGPEDLQGDGYFSTELERITGLDFDRQAIRALAQQEVLRDYQAVGVEHLLSQSGACLGDDMGLGKSRQVVVALRSMAGLGVVLIVCPASLRINWEREIHMIYPAARVGIVGIDRMEVLRNCQWIVANYERLGGLVKETGLSIAAMAIDEAHYLKEYDSGRTRNMFLLARRIPRRYVVTGTPLLSREIEMHTLLRITGHELGKLSLKEFQKTYAGSSEKRALLAQALRGWMLRRSKDVLPELGKKTRQLRYVSPAEGLGAYQEVMRDMSLLAMPKISKLRHTLESLKLQFLVETIEGLAEGDKIIVFCEYISTVEALREALDDIGIGCVTLVGSDNLKKRQKAVDAFQDDPAVTVFIGTTSAAGVGITLTAANYVMFATLPWTPALMRQAEDRAYRLGQKRNVIVIVPLVPETIDEQIWALLQSKRETEMEVVDAVKVALPGQHQNG